MKSKVFNFLFVGFVMPNPWGDFFLYLVNGTKTYYKRVLALTGMFASMDNDLLESSHARSEKGDLPPCSSLLLEKGSSYDLDFVIWYHLDLFQGDSDQRPVHAFLSISKGGPTGSPIMLPILEQQGWVIKLRLEERKADPGKKKGSNRSSK